jgi:dihydrofolate synthase/folylpolyglutamate synthase
MDHMQYLGNTLAKIAGEKAAIMKPGVTCVSVAQPPEAAKVIAQTAMDIGAPLRVQYETWTIARDGAGLLFKSQYNTWKLPLPALPGRHQIDNAGLALAALDQSPFAIPPFALRSGMRNVEWPARAQKLKQGPLVNALPRGWELWLDGGHNAGGGQAVADMAADIWADVPLHLVCGMLATKVAEDYLRPIAPRAASITCVPIPSSNAAMSRPELAEAAKCAGFTDIRIADTPVAAIRAVGEKDGARARVLICGSLYLAGEVLRDNS